MDKLIDLFATNKDVSLLIMRDALFDIKKISCIYNLILDFMLDIGYNIY